MKPVFLLLPLLLLATSCATILNRKEYTANFIGAHNNMSVKVYDSIYKLPAQVKLTRSKQDLPITVITDSVAKDAVIEHAMSPTFFYGNACLLPFSPILYGADMFSEKRFYYGKRLILDDTTSVYKPSVLKRYKKGFGTDALYGEKGKWNVIWGIPYGNLFFMQPRNRAVEKGGGFFGIFAGAEYYYSTRRFLSLKASSAIQFPVPVPAAVTIDGEYETMIAHTFSVMHNHMFKREIIGYGFNYGIYSWRLRSPDYGENRVASAPSEKDSHAFGASVNLQHQFSKKFSFGATYNAGIYNVFPQQRFLYQHVISFEFAWRIPI